MALFPTSDYVFLTLWSFCSLPLALRLHSMIVMKRVVQTLCTHTRNKATAGIYPIAGSQAHVKQAVARNIQTIPCECASVGRKYELLPRDRITLS